jgi:hypothetical protein
MQEGSRRASVSPRYLALSLQPFFACAQDCAVVASTSGVNERTAFLFLCQKHLSNIPALNIT